MTIDHFQWPRRESWERGDRFNGAGVGGYFIGGAALGVKSTQFGTITFANSTTGTATISAVITANSVVRLLGALSSSNDGVDKIATNVVITNTTTVTASRHTASGATLPVVTFVVVEYYPGVLKSNQDWTATMTGTASATATITAVVVARTDIVPRGTDYNTAEIVGPPRIWPTITLTNTTTVTVTRGDGTNNLIVSGTAAEFN